MLDLFLVWLVNFLLAVFYFVYKKETLDSYFFLFVIMSSTHLNGFWRCVILCV